MRLGGLEISAVLFDRAYEGEYGSEFASQCTVVCSGYVTLPERKEASSPAELDCVTLLAP